MKTSQSGVDLIKEFEGVIMNTGEKGLALIKQFEGLELEAYQCVAGVWTIGYGHTRTAQPGMRITESEAEELLREDLEVKEEAVRDLITVPLNQNEFDALASFVYNIGAGNFRRSTLRRKLNAGDRAGAADEFLRWNKARVNGELMVMRGLARRRAAERELFLTPVEETPNDPAATDYRQDADTRIAPDPPKRKRRRGLFQRLRRRLFSGGNNKRRHHAG